MSRFSGFKFTPPIRPSRQAMANASAWRAPLKGSESYLNLVNDQSLMDLRYLDPEQGTVVQIEPDVVTGMFSRTSEYFTDGEKALYQDSMAQMSRGARMDSVPSGTASWDPETGDIKVYMSPEEVTRAKLLQANAEGKGRLPMRLSWDTEAGGAPWHQNEDWKFSGRYVFVDENGNQLAQTNKHSVRHPYDDEFEARLDPEKDGQWWLNTAMSPVWSTAYRSYAYQATSQAEAQRMLSVMFAPDGPAINEVARKSANIDAMVSLLDQARRDAGLTWRTQDLEEMKAHNSNYLFTEWMAGNRPEWMTDEFLRNTFRNTPYEPAFIRLDPETHAMVRDANKQGLAQMQFDVDASLDMQNDYFNQYFDLMEKEDPERYRQMLEFARDGAYTQDRLGLPGGVPDRPFIIFHSNKYYDTAKMGYADAELPTNLWPYEIGTHAGGIRQSGLFAGSDVKAFMEEVGGRVKTNLTSRDIGGRIDNHEERLYDVLKGWPQEMREHYWEVRRYVVEEQYATLAESTLEPGKMSSRHIGLWQEGKGTIGGEIMHRFLEEKGVVLEGNKMPRGSKEMLEVASAFGNKRAAELLEQLKGDKDALIKNGSEVDDIRRETARTWINATSAENDIYAVSGKVMFPLVFRGKRPFRVVDLLTNDIEAQARAAMHYEGWTDSQRVRLADLAQGTSDKVHKDAVTEFRSILEEAGFDHIVYINQGEEIGQPSIIFWDPSLAKPLYGSAGFDKNSSRWTNAVMGAPAGAGLMEEEDGN